MLLRDANLLKCWECTCDSALWIGVHYSLVCSHDELQKRGVWTLDWGRGTWSWWVYLHSLFTPGLHHFWKMSSCQNPRPGSCTCRSFNTWGGCIRTLGLSMQISVNSTCCECASFPGPLLWWFHVLQYKEILICKVTLHCVCFPVWVQMWSLPSVTSPTEYATVEGWVCAVIDRAIV